MSFTKADLIDQVYASNSKMSKARAREAVEASLLIIKSSLEEGDDVLLSGFGNSMLKIRTPEEEETLKLVNQ